MNRQRPKRTLAIRPLDTLDDRIVPSGLGITPAAAAVNDVVVTARGGTALGNIYQEYVNYEIAGAHGAFSPTEANKILFNGTSVGVDIHFSGSNFNFLVSELKGIGMQVTASLPQNGVVEGYLPISQLPVVTRNPYESSISPIYKPVNFVSPPPSGGNSQAALPPKAGPTLAAIYQEYLTYEKGGAQGTFTSPEANQVYLSGTSVGVDIRFTGGDLKTEIAQLQGLGMAVTATVPNLGIIEGYLPISQLPTVAGNPYVTTLSPIYKPTLYTPGLRIA